MHHSTIAAVPIRPRAAFTLLAVSFAGTVLPAPAHAVPAQVPVHAPASGGSAFLAPHKATYDLQLSSTHGGGTVAASGSMSFQVTDACTGWAAQQRLHLQLVTREGGSSDMVSTYATLESKDGRHLTFDMQERDNNSLTQQVRGEASLDATGAGSIRFTLPHVSTMTLPRGTLFPMAHTAAIITAAEAGRTSIDPVLFDGTSADGPTDSYVSILGWHPAPSPSQYPSLQNQASGRVHVAFFARKPGTVLPDYEAGMRYFANGVSDQLDMDFGDFSMHGTMRSFVPGKPGRC